MPVTLDQFLDEVREAVRQSPTAAMLARCAACGEYVEPMEIPDDPEGLSLHATGPDQTCGPVYVVRRSSLGDIGDCPCGEVQTCAVCRTRSYKHLHVNVSRPGFVQGVALPSEKRVWCGGCELEARHAHRGPEHGNKFLGPGESYSVLVPLTADTGLVLEWVPA